VSATDIADQDPVIRTHSGPCQEMRDPAEQPSFALPPYDEGLASLWGRCFAAIGRG